MKIKYAKDPTVHFTVGKNNIRVPQYAVYAVIRADKTHEYTVIWTRDIHAARMGNSFVIYCISACDNFPRKKTVTARTNEYSNALTKFIRDMPSEQYHKAIAGGIAKAAAPKDRTIPNPIYHGRPDPSPLTQRFVTDGCRIGSRFYTEEAYWDRLK